MRFDDETYLPPSADSVGRQLALMGLVYGGSAALVIWLICWLLP